MPEALKDRYFQRPFFERLIREIVIQYTEFQQDDFYSKLFDEHWDEKPLKEMMMHSALVLRECLPEDYLQTLKILENICPKFGDFDAMIFPDVVRQFGLDHFDESMEALELFTQYSTAEFAIRPYIIEHEERTMMQMLLWSTHANEHVRRLSSEGCRPRLPWAMSLPVFKKNPSLILPILENLKSDDSLYVRKSVANNWNDITKDNPGVVIETFNKWKGEASEDTQWIMKHALRGLLKAGNADALSLMGFESAKVKLINLKVKAPKIRIGEKMKFTFEVINNGDQSADLMIDYIIHFQKANGKTAPKVFKLKSVKLAGQESLEIRKNHDFRLINTRKYYSGMHAVQVQINGEKMDSVEFEVMS